MRACVHVRERQNTCNKYGQMLHLFLLRKRASLLSYLKTAQNPAPGCYYLHNFADDPVEKSHQLACRQLNLLFQLVHRLVLEANSQEKGLEDGGSADRGHRDRPLAIQMAPRTSHAFDQSQNLDQNLTGTVYSGFSSFIPLLKPPRNALPSSATQTDDPDKSHMRSSGCP